MMDAASTSGSSALPDVLPIFPLTGVLLLPRGRLPLNIFEPRYLNMTEDALGAGRVIGMVQPAEAGGESTAENPEVYKIGCAGRMISFAETGDGRFLLTLLGVSRFRIASELGVTRGYRRARASYASYAGDREEDSERIADRERLLAAVRGFFKAKEIKAEWKPITESVDEALVTTLSMVCPFDPGEKQALLECNGLRARAELLTVIMELAVRGGNSEATGARH
ncbi:MAG: peptidase S16 [Rhodospirillales bacterium]|nr:peptidase S16 [Rhodospirillales bacterium]